VLQRKKRFPPVTRTPGLEPRLQSRYFAGFEPEDTVFCRVASWHHDKEVTVLLSPAPGETGLQLANAFEQVANHYYIEMLAKRRVSARTAIRWVQHWPARAGAPAPRDEDHFENVQLQPEAGRLKLSARQLISAADALAGLANECEPG
jgi:hypothetical protein